MENSSIPARASPHLPALSEGARLASLNATTGLDGSVYVEVYVTPIIKLLWYFYRQCRVGAAHENDAKVPTIRRYLRRLASEARGHETKKKKVRYIPAQRSMRLSSVFPDRGRENW